MTNNKNIETDQNPAVRAADAYHAWFQAKVREALEDHRPAVSHQQVMDEAEALLERKRRSQS